VPAWQGSGIRMNKRLTVYLDEKWWHALPLYALLEAKHGHLGGKGQKSDQHPLLPGPSEAWGCRSHCSTHLPKRGQGHRGCVSFAKALLTRNVCGKSLPKHERSRFLNAGLLLEACCFFNVSKIHLTSIVTPCNCNCNSQETSVCQNSRAARRRPTTRMIFIPWFQSQAREQVYERLIPPYMAAVSSHFFQRLRFSL